MRTANGNRIDMIDLLDCRKTLARRLDHFSCDADDAFRLLVLQSRFKIGRFGRDTSNME
ncbi:hypothetical protein D3C76_1814250 [compost metagenome]